MITFDSLTLKAFTEENINFFLGSRIQKIQQPTRREILLNLRNNGETRRFYVSIDPQFYHLCFLTPKTEASRFLEIPQKPPMFCMQLRKHLENAKIVRIDLPNNERIFEIYVETYNELQEKIELCLAIELMGKHSNIVLYNADTNIIIGCAHNVGSGKSREREMAGTLPYIYPPKQKKLDLLPVNGEINEPLENFFCFSKAFANQCKGLSTEKLKQYIRLQGLSPAITENNEEFSLFKELLSNPVSKTTVNEMIDDYFSYHIQKNKIQTLRQELITIINKKLSKYQKNKDMMSKRLLTELKGDEYRKWGDLIMANLYNNKDYQPAVTLFDWETEENVSISLDETITLKENANKFYKQYNKSKKSVEKINEMLEENEIKTKYYEQTLYAVSQAESFAELADIKSELLPVYQPTISKNNPQTKPLEKELLGSKVYIGKNNKQNDYIISKLAKDEDYWFHVHNCAGSHVLLQCSEPTDEMIFECAKLAKEYSSAGKTSKIGVIYTKRKYLKKPPKAPLGFVIYKNEDEIIV